MADTLQYHPRSVPQAYADIGGTLAGFGFERVQGSLYTTPSEDLANLFGAIAALKAPPWFRVHWVFTKGIREIVIMGERDGLLIPTKREEAIKSILEFSRDSDRHQTTDRP